MFIKSTALIIQIQCTELFHKQTHFLTHILVKFHLLVKVRKLRKTDGNMHAQTTVKRKGSAKSKLMTDKVGMYEGHSYSFRTGAIPLTFF